MAITDSIDATAPDGATQKVKILDDSDRTIKRQTQERMDDATQGIITGSWNDTTTKESKEGWGRVFTDTRANQSGLTRLVDGKVFVATDPLVSGVAFQYYNGAAWVDVSVATANLMADAVTTAKILNDNITTLKLATGAAAAATRAVSIWQPEVSIATDVSTTSSTWEHPAGLATLTFTITPESTNSIIYHYLIGQHWHAGGGGFGGVRIRKTTAGNGGAKTLASVRTPNDAAWSAAGPPDSTHGFHIFGWYTGETAAMTTRVEIVRSSNTYHLDGSGAQDGDTFPVRFGAIEFKR